MDGATVELDGVTANSVLGIANYQNANNGSDVKVQALNAPSQSATARHREQTPQYTVP